MLIDLETIVKKYDMNITGVTVVGAHQGQEYSVFKRLNITNIVMFEPLPHIFQILKNVVDSSTIVYNTALGNFKGASEMYTETANNGQSSSLLCPAIHLTQYPHIIFNNKVEVHVDKLDSYLQHSKNCNFLLIDVQGYELEVLKGGEHYLNNVDYIITEINSDEVYKDCVKVEDLDAFLSRFGFNRLETNWVGGNWGDAFYMKVKGEK